MTQQINTVVENLSTNAEDSSQRMEDITKMLYSQMEIVDDTKSKYDQIKNHVSLSISAVQSTINSTAKMKQKGSDISNIFQSISGLSEENAASTQQTSAASQEQTAYISSIADKADELKTISDKIENEMKKFKI